MVNKRQHSPEASRSWVNIIIACKGDSKVGTNLLLGVTSSDLLGVLLLLALALLEKGLWDQDLVLGGDGTT